MNLKLPSWLAILGIIFVVAKVMGHGEVATWSWWLVLLPFYFFIAVWAIVIVVGTVLGLAAAAILHYVGQYKRRKARIAREKEKMWAALTDKEDT